jgi:hypothetical protein
VGLIFELFLWTTGDTDGKTQAANTLAVALAAAAFSNVRRDDAVSSVRVSS